MTCKVCDSSLRGEVNRRLAMGHSLVKVMDFAAESGLPVSRPTMAKHKAHITDPRMALVKRTSAIKPSAEEFLGAVVSAASDNVASDPSQVTVNQGIKAATALVGKDQRIDVFMAIAALVTDRTPVEVIDGEYHQLEEVSS